MSALSIGNRPFGLSAYIGINAANINPNERRNAIDSLRADLGSRFYGVTVHLVRTDEVSKAERPDHFVDAPFQIKVKVGAPKELPADEAPRIFELIVSQSKQSLDTLGKSQPQTTASSSSFGK